MKGLEISNISEKSRQGSYGIVYTSWNADVVQDLLNETKKELLKQGVDENYDCGNGDGDCDGADEVEDGIADDEDNGDDGVFVMLATCVCP